MRRKHKMACAAVKNNDRKGFCRKTSRNNLRKKLLMNPRFAYDFVLCVSIATNKPKILVDNNMKFTIERASLLKTLSHMQSIVEKETPFRSFPMCESKPWKAKSALRQRTWIPRLPKLPKQPSAKPAQLLRLRICCMTLSANFPTVPMLRLLSRTKRAADNCFRAFQIFAFNYRG